MDEGLLRAASHDTQPSVIKAVNKSKCNNPSLILVSSSEGAPLPNAYYLTPVAEHKMVNKLKWLTRARASAVYHVSNSFVALLRHKLSRLQLALCRICGILLPPMNKKRNNDDGGSNNGNYADYNDGEDDWI